MLNRRQQQPPLLQTFSIFFLLSCSLLVYPEASKLHLASPEAKALLGFQSKADLRNHLGFSQNATLHFCEWKGVTCYQQTVLRLIIEDLHLGGIFAPDTLSHLDQLRVLKTTPSLVQSLISLPLSTLKPSSLIITSSRVLLNLLQSFPFTELEPLIYLITISLALYQPH